MAVVFELSTRLNELLVKHNARELLLAKLRDLQVDDMAFPFQPDG